MNCRICNKKISVLRNSFFFVCHDCDCFYLKQSEFYYHENYLSTRQKKVEKSFFNLNINYEKYLNENRVSISSRYKMQRRIDSINNAANDLGIKNKTLLDIGCGSGEFLLMAREYGYEIVGFDIRRYKDVNFKLYVGDFLGTKIKEKFAIITMWHVLEHLEEPLEYLKMAYSLLKEKGFLLIEVPIINSWQFKILNSKWRFVRPDHINYFSINSLHQILKRAGFKEFSAAWQGSLGLTNYLQRIISKDFDKVIQHHLQFLPFKKAYLTLCSKLHVGDFYRLFCVKI